MTDNYLTCLAAARTRGPMRSGRRQFNLYAPTCAHRQSDQHVQTELLARAAHQIADALLADPQRGGGLRPRPTPV